ncbi:MAG: hypothetical protein WBA89_10530 [Microcoleus sp.]|uniref:hypothetical protein n=1 Tax=Microcoleus sp. TaxID=44472 RepID=UPI003C74D39A
MRKLLYFATIGMLAFSIGGCGGDGGGNTVSPTPSPTLTPGASAPPAANTPGTPGATASPSPGVQTFPSPVVAAQPPGLIRSTNPDERARQAQADIDGKKKADGAIVNGTAIPQTTIPGLGNDPFSVLPPQPIKTDGGQTGSELPNLPVREVPNLPKLPDGRTPPQWTPAQRNRVPGGGAIAELPQSQTPVQISSLPNLPLTSVPQWRQPISARPQAGPGRPGARPGRQPAGPGRPGARPAGSPSIAGAPASSIPGLPSIPGFPAGPGRPGARPAGPGGRPGARPAGPPSIAGAPASSIPGLPSIPGFPAGPGGRPGATPGLPGATPGRSPAIAARPPSPPTIPNIATRELPGLPKLPEVTPPPSWQDPNPPPPPPTPAPPPPPPSTDNAKGVEVSGVVKVGNDILVIVKAPNEPTSRYIKVGQRIASGQVLIKRVDFQSGADPVVVLEENGVEVSKIVGEKSPQVAQNSVK